MGLRLRFGWGSAIRDDKNYNTHFDEISTTKQGLCNTTPILHSFVDFLLETDNSDPTIKKL